MELSGHQGLRRPFVEGNLVQVVETGAGGHTRRWYL